MSKHPLKTRSTKGELRRAERAREFAERAPDALQPLRDGAGFFSFSYTRTEISSSGGRTRVQARSTRLEDGRLSTETFDGELEGRGAFDDAVQRAQRQWLEQADAWLRSWSSLFPSLLRRRGGRD